MVSDDIPVKKAFFKSWPIADIPRPTLIGYYMIGTGIIICLLWYVNKIEWALHG
jgi:hypothetical protein